MTGKPAADVDVAVVGGGPVGLALAILLLQSGASVRVLERRTVRSSHSRAIGIHPPGLAALEGTGVTEQLTREGVQIRHGEARSRERDLVSLRFSNTSTRYPYVLALPQERTEHVLEDRLRALDPRALRRGWTVTSLADDGAGVTLEGTSGGEPVRLRASWVVAADGARSALRTMLGAGARGRRLKDSYLMGDFPDTTGDGPVGVLYLEPEGIVESFPLPGGKRRWVVHTRTLHADADAKDLARLVRQRTGRDIDAAGHTMLSAFSVNTTLVRELVHGRTVLIGDAAHEVSPIGGQGMTLGWLDAAELAPLLAAGLRGEDISSELGQFTRRRRRAAQIASAQAQLNMALGRPLPAGVMQARNLVLASFFQSRRLGDAVARRFTMQ
ncbi:FAD-dependent oxidoreductase [Arthrobacter caoxuetaonis]|uniref:FAD-dependent monooxygenase n=1 Tax=Arthrobacter caoxuetaonis TaxID=2886935 RepID=A0A9X1MI36_9MICC|nr:NAD(P)/FAD-dependent oxidoreductase [Arthrobacter caoxuetaonis]MCC3299610.1 FAD-dependent monooxygenase [Arthrobacter caoxuetaonis]USQ57855.1 FAD-dependent monooxygenase [Arthrobacter caoxuetaonis]